MALLETATTPALRVSVVIVSWRRPRFVRSCLSHLAELDASPDEVVVVDASPDELTKAVVESFPGVVYVRFPGGAGHMTTSRNVGLLNVSGDVVAFLDDDANVRAGWIAGLLEAFSDPGVGAVAGRTCTTSEEPEHVDGPIGQISLDGELTGNFAADTDAIVDVEHGIGANMSFRREVLAQLGGFRDDFAGVAVREDTDMFLRLRGLGHRAVFSPRAVVDHVGAPHVKGQRFDFRYVYWMRRNHALLLARNFGMASPQFKTWIVREARRAATVGGPNIPRRLARVVLGLSGVAAGLGASIRKARWHATDPVLRDQTGERIRRHLSEGGITTSS